MWYEIPYTQRWNVTSRNCIRVHFYVLMYNWFTVWASAWLHEPIIIVCRVSLMKLSYPSHSRQVRAYTSKQWLEISHCGWSVPTHNILSACFGVSRLGHDRSINPCMHWNWEKTHIYIYIYIYTWHLPHCIYIAGYLQNRWLEFVESSLVVS